MTDLFFGSAVGMACATLLFTAYGAAQLHRLRQIWAQIEGARKELNRLESKVVAWPTVERQELLLFTKVGKGEVFHSSVKPHIIVARQALAANPKASVRIGKVWSGQSIGALNAWAVAHECSIWSDATHLETFLVSQVPAPPNE
jgi:hypothetical protein